MARDWVVRRQKVHVDRRRGGSQRVALERWLLGCIDAGIAWQRGMNMRTGRARLRLGKAGGAR
jgi:hypothetical protein